MNLNRNLRYSLYTGLFLIPFVGFIVAGSLFFPYITGKNIVFRILIEIVAVIYVVLAVRDRNYLPKRSTLLYAFSAFIIVLFVADCFGIYPYKSFFSNFERMEGWVTHIHLFVYFLILSATLKTQQLWERFFQTIIGASIIMGIYGLNELSKGTVRIDGTLGNSSYLGVYMLINMFLSLFLLLRHLRKNVSNTNKIWATVIYGIIAIFQFIIMAESGTRGSLLGLFGGTVFVAVCFAIWEKEKKVLRYTGIGLIIVILATIGFAFAIKNTSFAKNNSTVSRFTALATTNLSGYASTNGAARFAIWGIAWKGVEQHPVLGWGQDAFNYVFNMHYDPKIYDQEQWFDRAHDVFLDWLIAGGVIGLIAYLSLYGAAIYLMWFKKTNTGDGSISPFYFEEKVAFTGLIIAYFIHNLFVFDSLTSYILFFSLLGYIHWRSLVPRGAEAEALVLETKDRPLWQPSGTQTGAVVTTAVVALVIFYYSALLPYLAASHLIDALSDGSQTTDQATAAALQEFKTDIGYNSLGTAESREQLIEKAASVATTPGISSSTQDDFQSFAQAQMEDQLKATPLDARYPLFYGSYLATIGDLPDAVTELKRALVLSPGKQTILFELGQTYLGEKDYTDALAIYKEAYTEAPSYTEAEISYALGAIYAGQTTLASQLLAPLANTTSGTDIRILKAYYDTGNTQEVLALLQQMLNIAAADARAGDKTDAISEINQVIAINPSFKTQGEQYISEIEGTSSVATTSSAQ
jgi:O-antigen ligase/tetratricopeptide (TPR) repeat protein